MLTALKGFFVWCFTLEVLLGTPVFHSGKNRSSRRPMELHAACAACAARDSKHCRIFIQGETCSPKPPLSTTDTRVNRLCNPPCTTLAHSGARCRTKRPRAVP